MEVKTVSRGWGSWKWFFENPVYTLPSLVKKRKGILRVTVKRASAQLGSVLC